MDAKSIEKMNNGRVSQIVFDNIRPILDECRNTTLSSMKNDFRSGDMDSTKLFAKVASLCTLDDIEQRLNSNIRKGNQAAKEIFNDN